jgi:hypothetical protein
LQHNLDIIHNEQETKKTKQTKSSMTPEMSSLALRSEPQRVKALVMVRSIVGTNEKKRIDQMI